MKNFYVVSHPHYANFFKDIVNIIDNKRYFLNNIDNISGILFTGGADVSPHLYGHVDENNVCMCNISRDVEEVDIFNKALEYNIPMFGICRGFQFLNVMHGGTLMHHVDKHGAHAGHKVILPHTGEEFHTNTLHHQMVVPDDKNIILAHTKGSIATTYIGDNPQKQVKFSYGGDIEAALFPDIKGFGVQWHPEMMSENSRGAEYYKEFVYNIMYNGYDSVLKQHTKKLSV